MSFGTDRLRLQYKQALVSSLGDAFPLSEETPIREIEINALTNVFFAIARQAQRSRNETIPGLSSQTLDLWAYRLGIPSIGQSDAVTRAACAAKYKAQLGPTGSVIVDAIEAALGTSVGEIVFFDGYTAEQWTYWAGVNPGTSEDLGTDAVGQWFSIRSHVLVVIRPLGGKTLAGSAALVEQLLFSILDPLLPAYATWDYVISNSDYEEGFTLDEDLLDYDGF